MGSPPTIAALVLHRPHQALNKPQYTNKLVSHYGGIFICHFSRCSQFCLVIFKLKRFTWGQSRVWHGAPPAIFLPPAPPIALSTSFAIIHPPHPPPHPPHLYRSSSFFMKAGWGQLMASK
jgi:hypothetical protein